MLFLWFSSEYRFTRAFAISIFVEYCAVQYVPINPRCGLRKECQPYAKIWNAYNPKQIETNPAYDALLTANQKRLISAEGIQLRTNRSIQMEGTFCVLKGDFQFKQFNHCRKDNVHKILYILAMGFNLAKLHNRIQSGRINKTLFEIKEVA